MTEERDPQRQPNWHLRARVFARDGLRCRECNSEERLEIDHIMPWARGGRTEYENLQTLCRDCNARKGVLLDDDRERLVGLNGMLSTAGDFIGMEVPVRITNAREAWGRIDVLVTPVDGSGEAWVSAERVKVRS